MKGKFQSVKGIPGMVCNELYASDIAGYIKLFTKIFGFIVIRREKGFVKLSSNNTILMLNDGHDLDQTHPFFRKITGRGHGKGVEMVFVVKDLERVRKAVLALKKYAVTPIIFQDWGLKDFRILTKEGFYLRVTEPFDSEPAKE